MITRPATAVFGCRGCRNAILAAVASRPLASFGQRAVRATSAQLSPLNRRLFSSEQQPLPSAKIPDSERNEQIDERSKELNETDNTENPEQPWFLEVEPPRHPPSLHQPTLPQPPEGSPSLLEPMIKYVYEDMGLDDISLLDLRDLDPPAALGPNLIMLFGTTRSERHLHISSGRFVRWLRRNYKVDARADGLIGPGELKTKLRRLRKKAKLMGTNTMILPGGDNGISTGWVCVNFSTSDTNSDETASFDESGRFSGFGAPTNGTTIVIQCMTEPRRNELDLETLWRGILRRNMEQAIKVKGQNSPTQAELESMVSAKIQLPKSPSSDQWQKMQQASQQHRYYSTSARRLVPKTAQTTSNQADTEGKQRDTEDTGLETLQQQVRDVQLSGTSITQDILEKLIMAVFHTSPSAGNNASDRLAIIDELLLTAQERGLTLLSKDMLVTLVEAMVTSPAYGPELERAQKNLEYLLLEMKTPLDQGQVLRLMNAYAQRQSWERFWDTFRAPARFSVPRSREMYELVYQILAATRDSKLCVDALRWVYPEMLKEDPPVYPTGSLYHALKACILTADPAAEELLHNPPALDSLDVIERRRLQRREFVRVLKEVEDIRHHMAGSQARNEREQALGRFTDMD